MRERENISALEIGTFEGRSALWLLENILTAPTAQLVCIDPTEGSVLERLMRNLRLSELSEKVTFYNSASKEILPLLPASSFDLIYIDGNHEPDFLNLDAEQSWPLLRDGGILIFDDYRWKGCIGEPRPKAIINRFLKSKSDQY